MLMSACASGGFSSLQKSDLEVEVDLSSLGTFNTAVAAMFSRLGVPIKTTVAPQVRSAALAAPFLIMSTAVHESQAISSSLQVQR